MSFNLLLLCKILHSPRHKAGETIAFRAIEVQRVNLYDLQVSGCLWPSPEVARANLGIQGSSHSVRALVIRAASCKLHSN